MFRHHITTAAVGMLWLVCPYFPWCSQVFISGFALQHFGILAAMPFLEESMSSFASVLNLKCCKDLGNSRFLKRVWRIGYMKEAKATWQQFDAVKSSCLTAAANCKHQSSMLAYVLDWCISGVHSSKHGWNKFSNGSPIVYIVSFLQRGKCAGASMCALQFLSCWFKSQENRCTLQSRS